MGRKIEQEGNLCPILRPTQKQFERPFRDYVRSVFRKHPDWACFKVRHGRLRAVQTCGLDLNPDLAPAHTAP
jgi:hypothetical protein